MSADDSPAVRKALARLEASLQAGQPYEGHEMLKTAFYRFRSRRQLAESYALAAEAAKLQFDQGQANCGMELGSMLVDAYVSDGADPDAEAPRLVALLQALPTRAAAEGESPPVESCAKLASAALKWLTKVGGVKKHSASLEGALAGHITRCLGWAGLGTALPHYARSTDLAAFAAALAAGVAEAPPDEEDLFLARAALQIACTGPREAGPSQLIMLSQGLLGKYHELSGRPLPTSPLMNFIDFYLDALDQASRPLVDMLLQRYAPALERDPSLQALAERCAAVHLRRTGGGGGGAGAGGLPPMFEDLFQQILGPAAS